MSRQVGYEGLGRAGRMIVVVGGRGCGYLLRRELSGLKCGRATSYKKISSMEVLKKVRITVTPTPSE